MGNLFTTGQVFEWLQRDHGIILPESQLRYAMRQGYLAPPAERFGQAFAWSSADRDALLRCLRTYSFGRRTKGDAAHV